MNGWTLYKFINEMKEQNLYDELAFYTLAHQSPYFIHQHIADAFAAQYANDKTKLITIYFALVGLYLFVENTSFINSRNHYALKPPTSQPFL